MKNLRSRRRRLVELFAGVAGIAILFMAFSWSASQAALVTRTWDGGGATNNWSDPANWSGDVVPTANDDVVFDGTSTKNAFINSTFTVRSFNIGAAYTGTISQSATSLFTIENGASSQAGGTFTCSGTVNFTNLTFNLTGGSFNCANGTFNGTSFLTLVVTGGTFTAPNGTMTFSCVVVEVMTCASMPPIRTRLSLGVVENPVPLIRSV